MSYLDWNQRVFVRVFNPDRERKTTSVYIDEDILYTWANEMGLKPATPDDAAKLFVQDCLRELRGDAAKIATYCQECAMAWRRKNMEGAPSYMGMLALLVLASAWGDGSGNLFYGRYWGLTGSDRKGVIPNIEELKACWKQLELYSETQKYSVGIYKVRTLAPAKVNVGVIVAQGVLRPADADALKDIFFDEGADPNVDYSDQHIKSWLEKHKPRLSARAQRALASQDNADYLISRVREELEEWDGEPADWTAQAGKTRTFKRAAYLCFNRGPDGAPYATIRLDFSGRSGDPESVLFNGNDATFVAHSNGDAVSTPLESAPDANVDVKSTAKQLELREPASFQKFRGGEFKSTLPGNSYRYTLNDNTVRVFVDGAAYGLSGYIESFGLRPGFAHIVMYRTNADSTDLRVWCESNRADEIDVGKHVPDFFTDSPIWHITAIRANAPACPVEKHLCLQYEVRPLARPSGGLKLFRTGNTYLVGCPPSIIVNSRNKIIYAINDGAPFEVTGQCIRLEQYNLTGSVKLLLREETAEGKESEINIRLLDGAEWAKDRDGQVVSQGARVESTPDDFAGFVGCWIAAFSTNPDDCDTVKASWTNLKTKQSMPCASVATIKARIRYMDGSTRHGPPSRQRDQAWRDVVQGAKLHPVFAQYQTAELWKQFISKVR